MTWIIVVTAIIVFLIVSLAIFCWRNAKRSLKPNTLTYEQEIAWNKSKGLWLDFDSYKKTEYEIKGKDGYVLHAMLVEKSAGRSGQDDRDNASVCGTESLQDNQSGRGSEFLQDNQSGRGTEFLQDNQSGRCNESLQDNQFGHGTGKYVILCHGHTSNRYGSVKYLNSYIKLGFSCIIYDARSHGTNAPDICTLGNIESYDLKCVIDDTRARYSDLRVLGLHGESMGSSASLSVVRFKPQIDFIVADCGFISCYDVVHDGYGNLHMAFLAPLINLAGKIIYHVDLKETCALKCLEYNTYPILFIHGAGDRLVKPYHSELLNAAASANGAYTELIMVEGAGHARSRYTAGFETYTGYIEAFLKRIGVG